LQTRRQSLWIGINRRPWCSASYQKAKHHGKKHGWGRKTVQKDCPSY
jgi:hypothetical protein